MSFRHSQLLAGSFENKQRMVRDLMKIGYTLSGAFNKAGELRKSVFEKDEQLGLNNYGGFGVAALHLGTDRKADYQFNIDNEWEYNAALAIASIVDDSEFHEGEWVRIEESGRGCGQDDIGKVTKLLNPITYKPRWGNYQDRPFSMLSVQGDYISIDRGAYRKVTPEEIIAHFKPKETVMKEEFKLPEKWYIERKEPFGKILNEWSSKKHGDSPWITNRGYIYSHRSHSSMKETGYTEITFEQFKKYVMKEEGKKIKEYKLKDSAKEFERPASIIAYGEPNPKTIREFIPDSTCYKNVVKAGVLDLWFEPVYEEEYKEIHFHIGNPKKNVNINSKGRINIYSRIFTIEEIRRVRSEFKSLYSIGSDSNAIKVERIWVGCSSEGTSVGVEDLDKIISEYNKLNP